MVEPSNLSRREREIVEAIVRLHRATVAEVREALADPPSYSAVRTTMGILVEKGHLTFTRDGRRYVYRVAKSAARLRRKALLDLVRNFFDGSPERLVQTLLDRSAGELDEHELDRIAEIVDEARRRKS